MADEAQVLDAAKKLPLGEQLAHSSWKVRAQALATVQERVNRAFSCEDEIFEEAGERLDGPQARPGHPEPPCRRRRRQQPPLPTCRPRCCLAGPLLAKAVGDSNANVMDKAVEALCAFLQKADEGLAARWVLPPLGRGRSVANRTRRLPSARRPPPPPVVICCLPPWGAGPQQNPAELSCRRIAGPAASVLASKCLKGKPATVARTGEACLLLVELEQAAPVVEAALKAFGDKVPKVVLAAVDIVLQAVRCGGGGGAGALAFG